MKSSKRKISLAVALVISGFGASAAMAQVSTALLGGGSTLVQPTIIQETNGEPVTYAGVGSGAGQLAFLNDDSTQLLLSAGQTVHFANSDAPLATTAIAAYKTGRGVTDGALIQIPFITTPITIPLVNAPAATTPVTIGTAPNTQTIQTVALSDDDLCGIFSGTFQNWNQVTNPATGAKYAAGAITVVYRADSSGTTDLLTAHLAVACKNSLNTGGVTFHETQHFANNTTDGIFTGAAPSNFVGETGSGSVASRLVTLRGASTAAVGYLSPDYTNTTFAPLSPNAQANNLQVASVQNAGGAFVLPTAKDAATAVGTGAAPTDVTNQDQWVPRTPNPSIGYPISGTSNIIVSQCYKSAAVTSSVLGLLNQHYAASNVTLLNGNGFAAAPSALLTSLESTFITGSRANLNIGNAVCGTKGR